MVIMKRNTRAGAKIYKFSPRPSLDRQGLPVPCCYLDIKRLKFRVEMVMTTVDMAAMISSSR